MLYNNVFIETIDYYLPPNVMSSAQVEEQLAPLYERLHLPEGRLELISGIKERRLWDRGTRPSQASTWAGQKALDRSGLKASDIDCLLHCSVSRDFVEPATATAVHSNLGIPNHALNFDISNACLGVLSGIITVANMIELGQISSGMIVAGEQSQGLLDGTIDFLNNTKDLTRRSIKEHFASLTIGSCASAIILRHRSVSNHNHRLLGATFHSNTKFNDLCQGGGDSGMGGGSHIQMQTNSELLLEQGVNVAAITWEKLKKELKWNNDSPDNIICHQVGRKHQEQLYQRLQIDHDKDFSTFDVWGNCGSTSLPSTTALAIEKGEVKDGNLLALLGIGSGINCMMLGIKW